MCNIGLIQNPCPLVAILSIYRKLDYASMLLCSLKNDVDEILRLLEIEYNKKCKKPAKK